jgi:L,D-transpeptidase catalytic domain
MSHPRRHVLLALPLIAVLLTLTLAIPHRMGAAPVADFAAPMSSQEAQARVRVAQQADTQRRDAIARTLGATSAAALPLVQNLFFSETNHHLSDRAGFLNYWRENGGVLLFGYPLSEEIVENGRVVQYFERARFEYHPENLGKDGQIQLSLLGRELTAGRVFPDATPDLGTQYFPETKHTLSGKFLKFWLKRGGLPVFGFPISEPFDETSPMDGQTRTTQYFERARFEYHPEALDGFYHEREQANGILLAGLHEIELGDLGRQAARRKGYAFGTSTQLVGAPDWSPKIWNRRIDVDLTAQHLTAYEGDTPVYQAPIATGKDGFNTPPGTFAIYSKYPIETMTGSGGGETWYVPDIPFVQYVVGGVALHGTYWHDQWGTGFRLSHGCINLNIDDAEWLYEWSDVGTQVDIHY